MANTLYLYVNPPNSLIQLTADNGTSMIGIPTIYQGRNDAQSITVPFESAGIGSLLRITADGYTPFEGRAVLVSDNGIAYLYLDDFRLAQASSPIPPEPIPPAYHGSPSDIINQVYQNTHPNLSTHDGCGKFTEDCCTALHDFNNQWWGHIRKTSGQNQYNGHAVDAVMLAAGTNPGIYDIIHDSVSPNASPQFIYKGPPDLSIWYYPA